jgi:hypothetical protein
VLRKHRITRKNKTQHAQERDRPEVQQQRVAFTEKLAALDPEPLVFVDEFGAATALTRRYGRTPPFLKPIVFPFVMPITKRGAVDQARGRAVRSQQTHPAAHE